MRTFKSDLIPPPPFSILWPDRNQQPFRAFEIGGGTGEFALQYAKTNPDCFLVSVERTKNKSDILLNNKSLKLPNNLFFIRADAIATLTRCVPDHSLDQVFILYPNPYPKNKQANQRWHNMPFMQLISQKMKPDGWLEIRTNISSYAEEAKERLTQKLNLRLYNQEQLSDDTKALTAFERKYLKRGEPCFRLRFQAPFNCK